MNKIERSVHYFLRYSPGVRKSLAFFYKLMLFPFGGQCFERVSEKQLFKRHFYGFHDKTPWSSDGRFLLSHRLPATIKHYRDFSSPIEVGFFGERNEYQVIDTTHAWNWQQGSTLHWVGNSSTFSYHKLINKQLCSVWHDVLSKTRRTVPHATAAVDPKGKLYASFCFGRFGVGAAGYGYTAYGSSRHYDKEPVLTIYNVADHSMVTRITLADLGERNEKGYHFFSHTLFSPDSKYLAFYHRWKAKNSAIYTQFIVLDLTNRTVIKIDAEDASHISWLSNTEIVAFCIPNGFSANYYIFNVTNGNVSPLDLNAFTCDGHPHSTSKGRKIVTDTYPDKNSFLHLYVYDRSTHVNTEIARYKSPLSSRGVWRCDLHPRFSPDGKRISIDLPSKNEIRSHAILVL